jgi:hypothetical protein
MRKDTKAQMLLVGVTCALLGGAGALFFGGARLFLVCR